MKIERRKFIKISSLVSLTSILSFSGCSVMNIGSSEENTDNLYKRFQSPYEDAIPWVYWYWMKSAVTKEGVTADLEAMQQQGIGGAYLMTIERAPDPPYINPPVVPLTPEWWYMVRFAMSEANRLGLKLAMTPCDGWALAGGPWITPELSMQKVVWTKTQANQGLFNDTLAKPENYKGYYEDIALYAYPSPKEEGVSTKTVIPKVTVNIPGKEVQYLVNPSNKKNFVSEDNCWIQLEFEKPFTCRSLIIHSNVPNYQAQRLLLQSSMDGKTFKDVVHLESPRHGWQNRGEDNTHTISPVRAKYYRFIYNKEGSEPGAEDLDAAKWKPQLNISQITLSSEAKIHEFEGKNGSVWRISKRSNSNQLPDSLCIPKDKLINITGYLSLKGVLEWEVPPGNWTILRIGHTSTGSHNAHAGAASGLECDKFNPKAAKIQFDNWFGEAVKQNRIATDKQVLKIFHVDSWECGSQNWSPMFVSEFKKHRGYDLIDYLPVMAGVPLESAETSEKVLSDVRQTIAELITDNFFGTMQELAHAKGCTFSAESVAPTMTSDGMLHFSNTDIPMGEFWYRSPTHDKPNDMLDAISAGHIYGKNIIQSESFTELRIMWDEHPAMLKTATDRNFALGINRFVIHVNTHNPWLNRKPGMTLNGIGLFFQRDQTWRKPGKAWIDYIQRCQALLQQGKPVVDIAVFTGEEIPRRAILPDRLVNTLPGIFGNERVQQEKKRLANKGVTMRTVAEGFPASANMTDPEDWMDPLRGYAYDSLNRDALLRLAKVRDGRIELPGGASYGILVIPAARPMSPNVDLMSSEVAEKLLELAKAGATILFENFPTHTPGLKDSDSRLQQAIKKLSDPNLKVLKGPYMQDNFNELGIGQDVILTKPNGDYAAGIGWTHRADKDFDIYFISNQKDEPRTVKISLRKSGNTPELWDPLTSNTRQASNWKIVNDRTELTINFFANGSTFIIMRKGELAIADNSKTGTRIIQQLSNTWKVKFSPEYGGPGSTITFTKYDDWRKRPENAIKYYSGTASYTQQFNFRKTNKIESIWLELNGVANIAEVYVNGVNCGVAWTAPYRVNISKALKSGTNLLKIEVTNTWANRLIGDQELPEKKRITWTNKLPIKMKGRPLLPAGLLDEVKIIAIL